MRQSQIICVLLLSLFVTSIQGKHTLHVDNIFPSTNDYVVVNQAEINGLNVGELDVGKLRVNSNGGFTVNTDDNVSLQGSTINFESVDGITFHSDSYSSTAEVTAGPVLNFENNEFNVNSQGDVTFESTGGLFKFLTTNDFTGTFDDDVVLTGQGDIELTSAEGNVALTTNQQATIRSAVSKAFGTNGYFIDADGDLSITAKQTLDSQSVTTSVQAGSLTFSVERNTLTIDASVDVSISGDGGFNVQGSEHVLIGSPQGFVSLIAGDGLSLTSPVIQYRAHRDIDIDGEDISFTSIGDTHVSADHGMTLEATTQNVNANADTISVFAKRLIMNHDGDLVFTSGSLDVGGGDTLSISSQGDANFITNSATGDITIKGTNGVYVNSGNGIYVGNYGASTPTAPLTFTAGQTFSLSGITSTTIDTPTLSIPNSNNIRFKNDYLEDNLLTLTSTTTFSATSASDINITGDLRFNIVGDLSSTSSDDVVFGTSNTDIFADYGQLPATITFTTNGATGLVDISSDDANVNFSGFTVDFKATDDFTSATNNTFVYGDESLSLNANTMTFTSTSSFTMLASNIDTFTTGDYILDNVANNFALITNSLSVDTDTLSWNALGGSFSLNWDNSLHFDSVATGTISAPQGITLIGTTTNFNGNWGFTAADTTFTTTNYYWQSGNYQDINFVSPVFILDAEEYIIFNSRDMTVTTTGDFSIDTVDATFYSRFEKDIQIVTPLVDVDIVESLSFISDFDFNAFTSDLIDIQTITISETSAHRTAHSATDTSIYRTTTGNIEMYAQNGAFNATSANTLSLTSASSITLSGPSNLYDFSIASTRVSFTTSTFNANAFANLDITTAFGDITFDTSSNQTIDATENLQLTGTSLSIIAPTSTFNADVVIYEAQKQSVSVHTGTTLTGTLSLSSNILTSDTYDALIQGDGDITLNALLSLAANSRSTSLQSNRLIVNSQNLNFKSNDDVAFNAGADYALTVNGVNPVDSNAVKIYSTAANADVTFASVGDTNIFGFYEVQINVPDLARGGSDVSFESGGSLTLQTAAPDPTFYSLGAIFSSGGTEYDTVLGLPYGQLFRTQTGSINLNSQGGDIAIFATNDFSVDANNGFTFKTTGPATVNAFGTTSGDIGANFNVINDGDFTVTGTTNATVEANGVITFGSNLEHSVTAGSDINFVTADGSISFAVQNNGNLNVTATDIDVRSTEGISINNNGLFGDTNIASGNNLIIDAEKGYTNRFTAASASGSLSLTAASSFYIKTAADGDGSISATSILKFVEDETITTGGGFSINSDGIITFESTAGDLQFTNAGSFAAKAGINVFLNSVSGQTYTADNAIRLNPSEQLTVQDSIVEIFAGGDSITEGVYGSIQGNLVISAPTNQIKYSADDFVQHSDSASTYTVTNGPIQFQATGTPGLANLITIFGKDGVSLSGSTIALGQSQFIELESVGELYVTASTGNVQLSSARLFNIYADRQLQVSTGFYWNMNSQGKFTYTSFEDTFIDGGNSLDILSDNAVQITSTGSTAFVQTGPSNAFSITTFNATTPIVFTTLSRDSHIAFSTQASDISASAQKITYNSQYSSVFSTTSGDIIFNIASESKFNAGGTYSNVANLDLLLDSQKDLEFTSSSPGSFTWTTGEDFSFSSQDISVRPDVDFHVNAGSIAVTSVGETFLESLNDFVVHGDVGATLSSTTSVDFVTRGKSNPSADTSALEEFGIRFFGNSVTSSAANDVNYLSTNSIFTDSIMTSFLAQSEYFVANGAAGIYVASLHNNLFNFKDATLTASNTISFGAVSETSSNGFNRFISDGPIEFDAIQTSISSAKAGLVQDGQQVTLETSTLGSITLVSRGRTFENVGVAISSLGYVNVFSNAGSVGVLAEEVIMNVEQRALASTAGTVSRFPTLSLDESGFQANQINMVAFGSNENGNGIQFTSYDPLTDIIIDAETRGVVTFDSGDLLDFEGLQGAEIAAFDDQTVTSYGAINIAASGRSFIDDHDASILLVSTSPAGLPNLGSAIFFDSFDNTTIYSADAIIHEATDLIQFYTGTAATFVIRGSSGFNLEANDQAVNVISASTFISSGSVVNFQSLSGFRLDAATMELSASREMIIQPSTGVTGTAGSSALTFSGAAMTVTTDLFEISEETPLIIPTTAAACTSAQQIGFTNAGIYVCLGGINYAAAFNSAL